MLSSVNVSCSLLLDAQGPASAVFQVVAAGSDGRLEVEQDGVQLELSELSGPVGGRVHVAELGTGPVLVRYTANVLLGSVPVSAPTAAERWEALRPSRYCPSDRLGGVVFDLLGPVVPDDSWERALAVSQWVRRRLSYVGGSSDGSDGALETLLSGQGVCRDYAHLVVALCRALDVPARTVSVYAPGLSPMDFHAVAEVAVEDAWWVLDATGLAPRPSMVRIATGRDAADTAFLTTLGEPVSLVRFEVMAVTAGDLPLDDHTGRVRLV